MVDWVRPSAGGRPSAAGGSWDSLSAMAQIVVIGLGPASVLDALNLVVGDGTNLAGLRRK